MQSKLALLFLTVVMGGCFEDWVETGALPLIHYSFDTVYARDKHLAFFSGTADGMVEEGRDQSIEDRMENERKSRHHLLYRVRDGKAEKRPLFDQTDSNWVGHMDGYNGKLWLTVLEGRHIKLLVSKDEGNHWTDGLPIPTHSSLQIMVVNEQEIWSQGTGENSLLCSTNGGHSWTTLRVPGRGGIIHEKLGHIGLRRVTLYGDGLLVTRDKGSTWTQALPQSTRVFAMDGDWLVARIGFEIKFGRLNAEDKVDWLRTLKFGDVVLEQLLVTDQGRTLRMLGSYEPPPVNPIVVFESHDGGNHFIKTNIYGCEYSDTAMLTRDGGGVCLTAWGHDIKVPRSAR